jgi:hypothetical protein
MSQVSCGKFRLGAPLGHRMFEVRERPTPGGVVQGHVGHHHRQAGTEEARVDPSEEEGQTQPGLGDPIAMGPRDPCDQAVQAQAPQLVRQPPGREPGQSEQRRQVRPEVTVTPAIGQQPKDDEQAQERLDDRVGEAQGGGPLPLDGDRAGDAGKRGFSDRTVVADALDVQETSVGI